MKIIHGILVIALCALGVLVPLREGQASLVENLTVAQMAARADLVVHGRVKSVRAAWSPDGSRIVTDVRLEVLSYVAGSGPRELLLRHAGGRLGDRELRVVGQPSFQRGQQVVAFLEGAPGLEVDAEPAWVVLCMAAGLFNVSFDRATGEAVLHREMAGVTRVGPAPLGRRSRVARPMLLRELRSTVQRARAGESRP